MSDVLDATGRPLDRIALLGLRARGRHGVLAAERELGQEFVVDVVLHLDTRPAAAADDLARTVHYGELAERVVAVLTGEPVDLLETLAQRIADAALAGVVEVAAVDVAAVDVAAVDVTVHKPQAPIPVPFADVSVRIRRWRQ
jgi:7,8-dihydroneopterin aldolase/epimerase/oxygenase